MASNRDWDRLDMSSAHVSKVEHSSIYAREASRVDFTAFDDKSSSRNLIAHVKRGAPRCVVVMVAWEFSSACYCIRWKCRQSDHGLQGKQGIVRVYPRLIGEVGARWNPSSITGWSW